MERLTRRQRQVVGLQGQGLSYKQIAERLDLSISSVKGHLSHAFKRTGVPSGHCLQRQLRSAEIRDIAGKIKRLLESSDRHVALSRSWPPL